MQREFDASNSLSLSYEGTPGSRLQRVDVGNITFTPPPSRFLTASCRAGNYGLQITNQFGPLRLQSIFAQQTGNVGQTRQFTIGTHRTAGERPRHRRLPDRTPALLLHDRSRAVRRRPCVPEHRHSEPLAARRASRLAAGHAASDARQHLPSAVRHAAAESQRPAISRARRPDERHRGRTICCARASTTVIDRSLLWFALVRPLNESNERLVVAYNVKINGRDTMWTTTGGTPDLQFVPGHDQVANLVMDPNVGPTSAAFRNEIRSVYRIAGEESRARDGADPRS